MNESSLSQGEGLSKTGLLHEFWKFRRCFLWRIQRLISNPDTAEDIFQEACLKFLSAAAVFHRPEAGTKYFCLILRSLMLQHLKTGSRLQYCSRLPEVICEPQESWDRNILLDRLSQAIANLSTQDQDLLATFFTPSLTLDERCKALHLPNSTMRYRAKNALTKLRKRLFEKSKCSSREAFQ